MQVHSAEFVQSAAHARQFLKRPIPHFIFSGRSNVGKSSILNKILKRKGLAKTSQTPGKTRLINYFLINDRLYFVDIPGYGFARVSKKERENWGKLIETYLLETPYIALIFQLLDIRHDPTERDTQMISWLQFHQLPFRILLTKSDKLSRNRIISRQTKIAALLGLDKKELIPTSAVNSDGVKETWGLIDHAYEAGKSLYSTNKDAL